MNELMIIAGIILLILIWNIAVFATYASDKRRAKKDERRVPEKRLLTMAALFGSLGALAGMYLTRHKTRKNKFRILVPIFFAAHCWLAYEMLL